MIRYLYDGTFEGLLTVIAVTDTPSVEITDVTAGNDWQPDLFTEVQEISTNSVLADAFFTKLQALFSKALLTDIGYCFLSEEPGIEKTILEFVRLLVRQGEAVAGNMANPAVHRIRRVSEKVGHEILRMYGFIRFRKLADELYYAAIEPDHNILQFLAPHFSARFADQLWLIHDRKRETGIYYNGSQCQFLQHVEMQPELSMERQSAKVQETQAVYGAGESEYQVLWNQYFQAIAITERRNKRAQRQRMPARYWKHLVEEVNP